MENEKLDGNPASKIKRKPENNDRIRFLSTDEEKTLTKVIRENWPHYLPVFLLSIHTGMRASEQLWLRWNDVELQGRVLTLWKTKPGTTRHVPLNSVALKQFLVLKAKTKSGFIFRNTEGDRLRATRDCFEPAVAEAGLTDYPWHCNRHTFASRLVMAGVDIRTVAQLMGHSTIQMTMRYAHLAPEHNSAAIERLVGFKTPGRVESSDRLVAKSVTGKSRRLGKSLKPA